nr:DNA dC->dU-editing enzyme APOBEC-3C isoform X3 [Oryctolagus cuniculus]
MESRRPGPRAGPGQACPGHYGRNPQHSVPGKWIRRLYQKTFYFHFLNVPRAFGRRNTFLCYQVEGSGSSSPDKGIFMKQMWPRTPEYHAEQSFLSWFENRLPLPAQRPCQVTWYLSWSPCSSCAELVAAFLDTHRNVNLTIYTARLYYHLHPEYRAGLCQLVSAGAQVEAMSFSEFEKCWEEFVYNEGNPFRPWRMLHRNYRIQVKNLQDILRGAKGLLEEETFCFQFNNQRRVPKPHRRRRPYLCYQLATPTGSPLHRGYLCNQELPAGAVPAVQGPHPSDRHGPPGVPALLENLCGPSEALPSLAEATGMQRQHQGAACADFEGLESERFVGCLQQTQPQA